MFLRLRPRASFECWHGTAVTLDPSLRTERGNSINRNSELCWNECFASGLRISKTLITRATRQGQSPAYSARNENEPLKHRSRLAFKCILIR